MRFLILPVFFGFLLASGVSHAQSVSGKINASEALKPAARRTPYGKPPAASTASSDRKLAAVWIEGTTGSDSEREEPEKPPFLDQKDTQFEPRFIVIRQGERVRVRNSDPIYHNVFSLSAAKKFDIGRRPKGEAIDVTFEKSGLVQVFCDIHSHMSADILVLPKNTVQWQTAVLGEEYRFDNLPAGEYVLKAYAPGFQEFSTKITVSASGTNVNVQLSAK
jgi:plastocyanin